MAVTADPRQSATYAVYTVHQEEHGEHACVIGGGNWEECLLWVEKARRPGRLENLLRVEVAYIPDETRTSAEPWGSRLIVATFEAAA